MSESMHPSRPHVGSHLRRRRTALCLTLQAVADETGLTTSYLTQLEHGRTNASVATLQRACHLLRLKFGDLFSDEAGPSPVLRVISGQVTVTVDGISHRLGELDSLHYRSSQPHRVG